MVFTVHRWFANKSCLGNWLYARLGDLASRVTANLGGSTQTQPPAQTVQLYRVRKTWADTKSQKGAFKILENAKKCANDNPGILYLMQVERLCTQKEVQHQNPLIQLQEK